MNPNLFIGNTLNTHLPGRFTPHATVAHKSVELRTLIAEIDHFFRVSLSKWNFLRVSSSEGLKSGFSKRCVSKIWGGGGINEIRSWKTFVRNGRVRVKRKLAKSLFVNFMSGEIQNSKYRVGVYYRKISKYCINYTSNRSIIQYYTIYITWILSPEFRL